MTVELSRERHRMNMLERKRRGRRILRYYFWLRIWVTIGKNA